MQRAIRLNSAAHSLWVEYFRLELDYVRRVRARRSVLGLSVDSGDTVVAKEQANVDKERREEESADDASDGGGGSDSGVKSGGDADGKAKAVEAKEKRRTTMMPWQTWLATHQPVS